MMPSPTHLPDPASPPGDACWSRIGIEGDRSCPRLPAAGHCRNCAVFAQSGQRLFDRETPPDYREQWTRQLAEVESDTLADPISLLVFRIGPEWLALEAGFVVEVIAPRPIHRVPHRSDRLLLGLANIRGELQLCASLRELLGIDAQPDAEGGPQPAAGVPRMLVAEHEQNRWVFAVDEVEGVQRVAAGAMSSLPYTVQRSARYYSQALFCLDERRIGLLACDRLFQTLERTVR